MGLLHYGRRLELTDELVAYEFAANQFETWDGVAVIPLASPDDWYVRSSGRQSSAAARVVHKAHRAFAQSGAWPLGVSVAS